MNLIPEFPHKAPKGYFYEEIRFKKDIVGIWISFDRSFDYNLGDKVSCIWGFYNTKTRKYHAPINSGKVGNIISINDTSPYSAMVPKKTILESFFV